MRAKIIIYTVILFAFVLTGCVSYEHYRSDAPDNVIINNNVDDDFTFGSVKTTITVKKIQPDCTGLDFVGNILLGDDEKVKNIGIPVNQPTHIQVNLLKLSLSSSSHIGGESTILIPKKGETYLIDVYYKDRFYEVKFKKKKGKGRAKVFAPVPLAQCRSVMKGIN